MLEAKLQKILIDVIKEDLKPVGGKYGQSSACSSLDEPQVDTEEGLFEVMARRREEKAKGRSTLLIMSSPIAYIAHVAGNSKFDAAMQ